jgi:hypothetical protein
MDLFDQIIRNNLYNVLYETSERNNIQVYLIYNIVYILFI